MKAVLKAFLLLVAIIGVVMVVVFIWIGSRGMSAKAQPGRIETFVARTMRHLTIPRNARELNNPVEKSTEVIAEGLAHYADHCAACHANDGSGETEIGLGMYPKPPDLRHATTQSLSDGELFYIIENGVRFTGMPAWSTGTEQGQQATWHLVRFIRELPTLTPDQIVQMKALNPRSPGGGHQHGEAPEAQGTGGQPSSRSTPHKH